VVLVLGGRPRSDRRVRPLRVLLPDRAGFPGERLNYLSREVPPYMFGESTARVVTRRKVRHPHTVRRSLPEMRTASRAAVIQVELRLLRQPGVVPDPIVRTAATLGPPVA
jgi:hypothetical protein